MGVVTTWRHSTLVVYKIMRTEPDGYVWNLASSTLDGQIYNRFATLPKWRSTVDHPHGWFEPTHAYLRLHGALPWGCVWREWVAWLRAVIRTSVHRAGGAYNGVVLVSHGNYRKERRVLEGMSRHFDLPPSVRLADSLYWRRQYGGTPRGNSLQIWHRQQFGRPIPSPWFALAHVAALKALLLAGRDLYYDAPITVYYPWQTPLVVVPGIGTGNEALLHEANIGSVEELWLRVSQLNLNLNVRAPGSLARFLTSVVHVSADDSLRVAAWVALSFNP